MCFGGLSEDRFTRVILTSAHMAAGGFILKENQYCVRTADIKY